MLQPSASSAHQPTERTRGRLLGAGLMLLACAAPSSCASKLSTDEEQNAASAGSAARSGKSQAKAANEEELDQTETPLPDDVVAESGHFIHRGRANVVETLADATSENDWYHLDLDTGEQTEDDKRWDLAFSRFRVRINGGMSGPGAVEVASLMERFDAVTALPEDAAFSGEAPDSTGDTGDTDSDPDNAFNSGGDDWFVYNLKTHELTPRQLTFVIKSTEKHYYRLRFVDYYDEAGSPGRLTLRWARLKQ